VLFERLFNIKEAERKYERERGINKKTGGKEEEEEEED